MICQPRDHRRGPMLNPIFAFDSQAAMSPAKIGIAPELGKHNVDILTRLDYSEAQIQKLVEKR